MTASATSQRFTPQLPTLSKPTTPSPRTERTEKLNPKQPVPSVPPVISLSDEAPVNENDFEILVTGEDTVATIDFDDDNGDQKSSGAPLPIPICHSYMAIFEDALEQLAVLGDVAPDVGRSDGSKVLGDEISRILKDQKNLEAKHQELVGELEKLKTLPNKTKYKECQMAILDVTNQMQQMTQALARSLKAHPSVAQNLLKVHSERNNLQAILSKTIRELREGKYTSLTEMVEDEYRKKDTLRNTIEREMEASQLLKDLQREVTNEEKLMQEEINDRNQIIQQLKDTIQEISVLSLSERKYIKKETHARETSVKQQCFQREEKISELRENLVRSIEMEKKAHEGVMDFLTRQREQIDTQIQDWMTRFDEDTEKKAQEVEGLKQKRAADLDKFEELVAKYEELDRLLEEDRIMKKRDREERRMQQRQEWAAKKLQRWWRNWMKDHPSTRDKRKSGKKSAGKKKK